MSGRFCPAPDHSSQDWLGAIQFVVVMAYTVSIYVASQFVDRRLGLSSTARVLEGLTLGLIPLTFFATHWLASPLSWLSIALPIALSGFAVPAILRRWMIERQPTFEVAFGLMAAAMALPIARSALIAVLGVGLVWLVATAGMIKATRHAFWLEKKGHRPKAFGYLPPILMAGMFVAVSLILSGGLLPIAWVGTFVAASGLSLSLTTRPLLNVHRRGNESIEQATETPVKIALPMIVSIVSACAGLSLAMAFVEPFPVLALAAVLAAIAAAWTLGRTSLDWDDRTTLVLSIVAWVLAYQSTPLLFQSAALAARDAAASAMGYSQMPKPFYGVTYLPVLVGLMAAYRHFFSRNRVYALGVLRSLALGLSVVLLAVSVLHPVACFMTWSSLAVIWFLQANRLETRFGGLVAIIGLMGAMLGAIPAANQIFGLSVSMSWGLPMLIGSGVTVCRSQRLSDWFEGLPSLSTRTNRQMKTLFFIDLSELNTHDIGRLVMHAGGLLASSVIFALAGVQTIALVALGVYAIGCFLIGLKGKAFVESIGIAGAALVAVHHSMACLSMNESQYFILSYAVVISLGLIAKATVNWSFRLPSVLWFATGFSKVTGTVAMLQTIFVVIPMTALIAFQATVWNEVRVIEIELGLTGLSLAVLQALVLSWRNTRLISQALIHVWLPALLTTIAILIWPSMGHLLVMTIVTCVTASTPLIWKRWSCPDASDEMSSAIVSLRKPFAALAVVIGLLNLNLTSLPLLLAAAFVFWPHVQPRQRWGLAWMGSVKALVWFIGFTAEAEWIWQLSVIEIRPVWFIAAGMSALAFQFMHHGVEEIKRNAASSGSRLQPADETRRWMGTHDLAGEAIAAPNFQWVIDVLFLLAVGVAGVRLFAMSLPFNGLDTSIALGIAGLVWTARGQLTRSAAYYAAGFALMNGALWHHMVCCGVNSVMWVTIPTACSLLLLEIRFRDRLPKQWHEPLQYLAVAILSLPPLVDLVSGDAYAAGIVLIIAAALLVIAILLRSKALLLSAVVLLAFDLIWIVVDVTMDHRLNLWLVGLTVGGSLIGAGAWCERHRNMLLSQMRVLTAKLETWN
ncbi:MAG: hypothetical protein AAF664_11005 [Planctomycetota bacterium]